MSTRSIEQKARELHRVMNQVLPRQAKDIGLAFFKYRFRAQGWHDKQFTPWPRRKRTDKRRPGRGILMDRGKLRNSIRGTVQGDTITFGTDVRYAKIHNEGGVISHPGGERIIAHHRFSRGKNKGRTLFSRNNSSATFAKKVHVNSYNIRMPQRKFMGESAYLNNLIKRKIETTINKVFK